MQPTPPKGEKFALRQRILVCAVLMLCPFIPLAMRLYQVQITQGASFYQLTHDQTTRFIITPPIRGQILTADNKILAGNTCKYDLTMNPSEMRMPRGMLVTSAYMLKTATFLEENILNRGNKIQNITTLRSRLRKNMAQPIVLFSDLTPEEIARYEEMIPPIKGITITPRIERDYPFPGIASQVTGMVRWRERENNLNLSKHRFSTYISKELTGIDGIERRYNRDLGGASGIKAVIIDPSGFVRDELPGSAKAINGFNITLTLDSTAQIAAEQVLHGYRGALVAMNPQNGRILAMASAPTYNLANLPAESYRKLLEDKEGAALLNRATSGSYMPGSIVKPLVALAALENGIITPETTFDCTGKYTLGDAKIHCAKRGGHGILDLTHAIAFSCNPYFIHTGIQSNIDALNAIYSAAGFGKYTGIDIDEGSRGLCPSRELAPRLWKRKWGPMDTAYVSIGQGALEITPLQAAVYTSALANGGNLWKPFVVWKMTTQEGQPVRENYPILRGKLPVSQKNLAIIQKAMENAINLPGASAAILQEAGFPMAAKTGTAEVGTQANRHKNTWFICYGPLPHPTFAIACVIEDGISGGRTAAPVVLKFLQKWLKL